MINIFYTPHPVVHYGGVILLAYKILLFIDGAKLVNIWE
jgi:hypothetical protein